MLRIRFDADTKPLDAKVDQSTAKMEKMRKASGKAVASLAKWGAAAALAAAGGAAALVVSTMKSVDAQQQLIDKAKGSEKQLLLAEQAAKKFGNALSETDTNAIRNAHSDLQKVREVFTGFITQMTAKFAPVIQAVSRMFLEAAEGAGDMGDAASTAFDYIIEGAAFVASAVDGIQRVFKLAANATIIAWTTVMEGIARYVKGVLAIANKVPFVDVSGPLAQVEQFADTVAGVRAEAFSDITSILEAEMAGDKLKRFVEEAQKNVDVSRQRTAVEVQEIDKRLEALRNAGKTELQLAQDKWIKELEIIKEFQAKKQITVDEANELSLQAAERYNEVKLDIERKRMDEELRLEEQKEAAKRNILSGALSSMTTLMNSGSRKLFEVGKVAAIAQAMVATYTGAAEALKLGWPLGPPAAAAITVAGLANVANIKKQTMGGGGGGGASASATTDINAKMQPVVQRNISIDVQGDSVNRDTLRSMMSEIGDELGDNVWMGVN